MKKIIGIVVEYNPFHNGHLYQINKIMFDNNIEYTMPNEETIILPNDFEGTFDVYYYKIPKLVKILFESEEEKEEEDNTFEFELDDVLLEIMPYGIASDLLKMDMISGYGTYFTDRYREMKSSIDPRRNSGMIRIVGGCDI